jgi:hypothetical protein
MSPRRILPVALVVAAAALPAGAAHATFIDNPGSDTAHIRAAAPYLAAERMRMLVRRDGDVPARQAARASCEPSL